MRREPQRSLVIPGGQIETPQPHMGIAKLGVQASYHFTWRIGGAPADLIALGLRGGDGFIDPAGRGLVLPVLEMLSRRQSEGFDGLDG